MTKSEQKIADMTQVVEETRGKRDLVSKWAKKGVLSEIQLDMSYLERRLNEMYSEFPLPKENIAKAERYLRKLTELLES